MKHFSLFLFCAVATAGAAFAQKWEVGAGVGGAFYTSQSFTNAGSSATGSLSMGPVVSAWLGNNSGRLLGGEFRYDYEFTNLELNSGGTKASFGAQTHSFHYDFLFHFAPREARIRPFVAAGGGIKMFRGTGTEQAFQPLSNLGLLSKTSQIEGLVSVGGGVKFTLASIVQLRLEVHDYLTPFPNKVIAPGLGAKGGSGWLQDFVPMAALAITF
ncbi:MAG TPA: outer membrane beta-barrel protein [Bryobacteraceae bacterium]|nr:outer membrane beta-barrel protein [Bryobacteraceae bacterium]